MFCWDNNIDNMPIRSVPAQRGVPFSMLWKLAAQNWNRSLAPARRSKTRLELVGHTLREAYCGQDKDA